MPTLSTWVSTDPCGKHTVARIWARGDRWSRLCAAGFIVSTGLLISGCADNRISLETLHEMELELAATEPVAVEPARLPLTDVHPYTVGSGDVLSLTLVGLMEEYSETKLRVRVREDGRVSLPLVGEVDVAGQDLQRVEKAVYDAHVPTFVKALSVYVELVEPDPTTVVVVGAAGKPGLVPLRSNQRNVLYAVAHSGGFLGGTSGRVHVRPIRSDQEEQTYDLTDVNDLRRAMLAPPLESGDMVVVESADADAVYVTGLVNAPGLVPVPHNGKVSLVRTIAASGGLRDFLDPGEATLWRKLPDGKQVRVKLELTDIMNGKSPDLALLPGDVLDVPHTGGTRFREWFAANIRLGPFGVSAMYDPWADYRARILSNNDNDVNIVQRSALQALGGSIPQLIIPPVNAAAP